MKLKNIIAMLIAAVMVFSMASCVMVEYPTVLTIDDSEITLAEYNYYFNMLKLQAEATVTEDINTYWETEVDGKTTFETLKDRAYEEMMNLRIFYHKAKSENAFTDEEIRETKSSYKQQMLQGFASEDELLKQLDTDSKTVDMIAEMMAVQTVYIGKLTEDKTIDVTTDDIKEAYEKDYMAAKHILFMTVDQTTQAPLSEEEVAEKKKLAEDILAQIKGGADFDTLMNQYSEDTGLQSYPDGYVFTTGEMVQEFEDAAKNLEVGNVSDLVETPYGYHIIKRIELNTDETSQDYQQASQTIYSTIVMEKATELAQQWKNDFKIVENKTEIDKISAK